MKRADLAYRATDRSVLLPYYRRWLVDPIVARLPAELSPNTITHVGHALNLAALAFLLASRARSGLWFFAAAALVQLYVVCDNLDGAHARRTRQTSPMGEMLDHGLDILNVAYIAAISALGLGLDTAWGALLIALVTGASAVTFFEQRVTGVFFLGRLNQQESSLVVSAVLCTSGALGVGWWRETLVLGVPMQTIVLALSGVAVAASAFGALDRVRRRRGWSALGPALTMLWWNGTALWLALADAISPRVALALVLSGNVFFAGRMLARRICRGARPRRLAGPPPCIERTLVATLIAAGVLATLVLGAPDDIVPRALAPHLDSAVAAFCSVLFGIALVRDTRRSLMRLRAPQGVGKGARDSAR